MYIKEIKLNSFKSFADKVSIQLNSDFTGIVGPNGSGKSNIVDAIKWVLGEQSVKNLRGSSGMVDIIFSGSESRNSANHASVSITFDNSDKTIPLDYNDITIKRVLSKTGENEYYLNNDKCRLKDISDLLLDSFSSKESFNIIPQNKIEEILSDKPEDRRVIFEEASGVLKYKKRKEESLRKLAKTHENIERIDMIINELSTQIKPLEIASKKAYEYKENKEKLDNLDIALMVKDITSFNELLNIKKEDKEKYSLELVSFTKESTKKSTQIEKLKLENLKLEEKLSNLREEYLKNKELLSELLSKKELAVERSKYDKNSDNIKNKLIDIKEEELKISNEIKLLKSEVKSLEKINKNYIEQLNKLKEEFGTQNSILKVEESKYNDLIRKQIETSSKIELLNSNIENMAKLPYSVKAILDNPSLKGINNIIGNIVNAKEEYKTMLEVALSSSINYIIVDNDECAKDAINYLRLNNKGRATFFPLNIIKPKSIDPSLNSVIKTATGFISIASDLVDYDTKYSGIIKNQLGNIIVVDNIDNAISLSKKINYRYRIVTLAGELLHVGGSLSGGSLKQNNSYISDKYEIEKLKILLEHIENNIKDSKSKIIIYEKDYNVLKEKILNINVEITKNSEKLISKNQILNNLITDENKKQSEIEDLSEKSNVNKLIDGIMEEYYELESLCKKQEKEIEINESDKRRILDDINELESLIKKEANNSNNFQTKISEIEIELVKLNMAIETLLNKLNEDYSITYDGAKNKYSLEIDEREARKIVSDLKKSIKLIGNVNLESIDEYERVNTRYTFLTSQKQDLINSEKDLLEIINNMDSVMKEKFESTFNKINKEFSQVFRKLFSGGQASLKLTDPSNLLETGIEIIAIPPGKNLKPLSLLSGGEKTLTAISLLFSIMNLKKVPFVVLDEVESALDEVNAEKFGEYLENYRNKTQLLIITHKKKTMEYVDLLYGVTMQESGVSKLVSVKLEDIKI